MRIKTRKYNHLLLIACWLLVIILSRHFFIRIDLTEDKRYSISEQSKTLMRNLTSSPEIAVYLDGDLNAGFLRLKRSTLDLINELAVYASGNITPVLINPSVAGSNAEREEQYARLEERGLTPTAVYERDKEGKSIRKIIFPWIEITYNGKTEAVRLLKNLQGLSGEENLNISIENLEFEITDAIERLSSREVRKIAFIEGHGELSEQETYDISLLLSRYFQIDRGVIGHDAAVLDDYKMVIVARPVEAFSETEKFILDQYIMNGGKVLWLLDAVQIAPDRLSQSGASPAVELDVNLKDLFFRYGVRINPVLVQDVQCTHVPVNIAPADEEPHFEPVPWFYYPLLLTASQHPVTRNIAEVRGEYCSALELVGRHEHLQAEYLLATSDNSHIVGTPAVIDLSQTPRTDDTDYFHLSYIPVAVALEGIFPSNFTNRIPPKEIINPKPFKSESQPTRQVFIADGDIIRNGVTADNQIIPVGYDRYTNRQFGNKDFIRNVVLYLADSEGRINLRSRTVKLRLLNSKLIENDRLKWQLINLTLPLALLAVGGLSYRLIRKRKYTKV
ncbi:MAG: gliding motility-associated ABC transporter substrate-binding protein GldG [Prevotellaceae bacterium]|jgi:ABC-2 type transport system permease protein|nr:gliding motility-associated ABC transporter substrate-binding protein GldG [Prevotellaceae bacterium]